MPGGGEFFDFGIAHVQSGIDGGSGAQRRPGTGEESRSTKEESPPPGQCRIALFERPASIFGFPPPEKARPPWATEGFESPATDASFRTGAVFTLTARRLVFCSKTMDAAPIKNCFPRASIAIQLRARSLVVFGLMSFLFAVQLSPDPR